MKIEATALALKALLNSDARNIKTMKIEATVLACTEGHPE
jgi:hypothetical protein